MDRGFIKLWRKIINSPVFYHPDHELFRVWIFLLLTATYKEFENSGKITDRGQVLTSREDLQEQLFPTGGNALSEKCCWKLLRTLVDMENIRTEDVGHTTVVTITNWSVYQARDINAHRGFFKLYRKIRDSDVFMIPELLKVWIYCLASACYDEVSVPPDERSKSTVCLDRGQFTVGRNKLRKDLFGKIYRGTTSAMTCWRWLHRLADMSSISIKSFGSYSIVTVNNWDIHQG